MNVMAQARAYAERKLALIIEREGDCGGARREPWYLEQLAEEATREITFSQLTQTVGAIAKSEDENGGKKGDPRWQTRITGNRAYESTPIVSHEKLNCNRRNTKCRML